MKLNKYIDHTLLKSTAREEDIRKLCAENALVFFERCAG